MLVEVVAHPVDSKYISSDAIDPDSVITSYAGAAASPATPDILKHLEAPCLKLCMFIAVNCQVKWNKSAII
jgi:hypothetical protein